MKLAWQRYKIVILIVLAFLFIIPIIVLGVIKDSYRANHGAEPTPLIYLYDTIGVTNTCVYNTSTVDYFVPTKTRAEWDAFVANHPAQTKVQGCCGDLYCNYDPGNTSNANGPTEAFSNLGNNWYLSVACPTDCTNSCGDQVCNGTDLSTNCDITSGGDCCFSGAACGSVGCQVTPSCASNTQTCSSYYTSVACNSGACSHTSTAKTSICGGGENAMCSGSYNEGVCFNYCTIDPLIDHDGDTIMAKLDTDCGGCGNLCTGGAASGCNPDTNCWDNGGSCGYSGTWLNGKCMNQTGACSPGCSTGSYCYNHACQLSNTGNCPPGYYGTNGSCTKCQTGYYSAANTPNSCSSCPADYQCTYGVAIRCPLGTGNSGGSNTCTTFPGYNGNYS